MRHDKNKTPLTSLAHTAIDRIENQIPAIAQALLVYADTDTLCYRSGTPALAGRQIAGWDPILIWAAKIFGAAWEVTTGIMPVDQPPALHRAVNIYLSGLDAMQLSAACVLASGFSSLALTLAVLKKYLNAEDAFALSRLEETFQAETWGQDEEAEAQTERLHSEILDAGRFLELLE